MCKFWCLEKFCAVSTPGSCYWWPGTNKHQVSPGARSSPSLRNTLLRFLPSSSAHTSQRTLTCAGSWDNSLQPLSTEDRSTSWTRGRTVFPSVYSGCGRFSFSQASCGRPSRLIEASKDVLPLITSQVTLVVRPQGSPRRRPQGPPPSHLCQPTQLQRRRNHCYDGTH